MKIEVYLLLFGISCLSLTGLKLAAGLVFKALREDISYAEKFMYFLAYFWIIGVVLYVLCEPVLS